MGIFDDLDEMPSHSTPRRETTLDARETTNAAHDPEGTHREVCAKCSGSGRFGTYRTLGRCFACKGLGYRLFKASPEARAKAKDRAKAKKARDTKEWTDAHPAEWAWIHARAGSFDFARSMLDAATKYHSLTANQLAAVQKCMAADAERAVRIERERAERAAAAPAVDITAIVTSMTKARSTGIEWPKLRLGEFKFSFAGEGKNAGAIYVKQGEEYLGKIMDGRLLTVRACGPEREAAIVAVCADPKAAAIAYGMRVGKCSCCGRKLTNKASVELGIGPICADNFGW